MWARCPHRWDWSATYQRWTCLFCGVEQAACPHPSWRWRNIHQSECGHCGLTRAFIQEETVVNGMPASDPPRGEPNGSTVSPVPQVSRPAAS